MNNTKWKYLFEKIIEFQNNYHLDFLIEVKYLLEDMVKPFSIPTNFYAESHFETWGGVAELKEIEYLFIPNKIFQKRTNRNEILEPKVKEQEIEKMMEFLKTQGKQIEYEKTENGIFIYGYGKA